MNYALIENGVIENIIYLHPMNAADFPNAVPLNDIPAGIGDTYDGTHFYRDGERVLTYAEQMLLEQQQMQEALALLGVDAEAINSTENEEAAANE